MITLRELSKDFLLWVDTSHTLERKTRAQYNHGWNLLAKTSLAKLPLDKINRYVCDSISFPGGPSNANAGLRTLRRMLSYAQGLGIVPSVPEVPLRKEWPRSVSMSRNQAERIASFMAEGDPKDAFLILRATGMRPSECFSMRWEHVAWDSRVYLNPRGKRASSRRPVPLLFDSMAVLGSRHSAQGLPASGWIFPARTRTGHLESIQKAFVKARDLAGYPKTLVLYSARHGAATDLAQVLTLKETMSIMGHTSVDVALRYQHPNTVNLEEKLASKIQ